MTRPCSSRNRYTPGSIGIVPGAGRYVDGSGTGSRLVSRADASADVGAMDPTSAPRTEGASYGKQSIQPDCVAKQPSAPVSPLQLRCIAVDLGKQALLAEIVKE